MFLKIRTYSTTKTAKYHAENVFIELSPFLRNFQMVLTKFKVIIQVKILVILITLFAILKSLLEYSLMFLYSFLFCNSKSLIRLSTYNVFIQFKVLFAMLKSLLEYYLMFLYSFFSNSKSFIRLSTCNIFIQLSPSYFFAP